MQQRSDKRRLGYAVDELTIGRVLRDKAEKFGDRIFLRYLPDGRSFSFRDLDAWSNRIANGLIQRGVAHGVHVAVIMDNSPEQLSIYFALGKIGAVAVPINSSARGQLLEYFLNHSDSTVVVIDEALLPRVLDVQSSAPAIAQIIVLAEADGQKAVDRIKATIPIIDFADVCTAAAEPPPSAVKFSDLAFIKYTSGTTGPSKGVMFTQARSILYGVSTAEAIGYRDDDVFYVSLPLFHANGLLASTYTALVVDASVCLQRRFSGSRFWSDIRACGATTTNLLGSMANVLWAQPQAADDRINNIRIVSISPVPVFARDFEARFGLRIVSNYGLTDYGTPCSYSLTDPPSKLGSAGRARQGWEVRIVDVDDFGLPAGETGEIAIRSNNPWDASSGYYKMPEATLTSLRNGWFHTGDRGLLDDNSYLWFQGRQKDMIRRRGENISSYEVEQVICSHPSVAEAAAYPVPSELSEDEIAVTIVMRDGAALTEREITEYCIANMAHFMVPRFIRFVSTLPRTLTQKVEKYRLTSSFAADANSYWDRDRAGLIVKR